MEDSKFQKSIYHEVKNGKSNIVVSAVAGSGKTTTIVNSVKLTPKKSDKLFLAFNNSIVEELKKKIIFPNSQVTTMHSFCWRAILRNNSYKAKLKKDKSRNIIKKVLLDYKVPKKKHGYYGFVISKVLDLARLNLLTELEEFENIALRFNFELEDLMSDMVLDCLIKMNEDYENYDFVDMIYRACIDEVRLPKYDFVFVDESQDLSTAQQYIISQILKKNGRMIAVGDPNQAIYGFAGADSNSYENLKQIYPNTIELPLSINYRCAKRIVKEANKWNKDILPFDSNIEGEVRNGFCKEIKVGDWVLCRNLKPLIFLNLYLISKNIRSYIKGGEVGKNLENYIKSFNPKSLEGLFERINKDITDKADKLRAKGVKNPYNTEKIDKLIQKRDIIKVVSQGTFSVNGLVLKIRGIFKEQKNAVLLSTIHKSKGLENDRVFILCPELIPNKFATKKWQLEQEDNLFYVAVTRAKKSLIYIENFKVIEKKILNKIK